MKNIGRDVMERICADPIVGRFAEESKLKEEGLNIDLSELTIDHTPHHLVPEHPMAFYKASLERAFEYSGKSQPFAGTKGRLYVAVSDTQKIYDTNLADLLDKMGGPFIRVTICRDSESGPLYRAEFRPGEAARVREASQQFIQQAYRLILGDASTGTEK